LNPFSLQGRTILENGIYEPDLVELIRNRLPKDGVFLDVGANEGIFSAIAAKIATEGLVIAVEPQSRLRDVLEINLALNARGAYRIFQNAIGDEDGLELPISLTPMSRSGGSSLVRKYRWSNRCETVEMRTMDTVLSEAGAPRVNLLKIDVEGYEPEVIQSARNLIRDRRVDVIAIDYHQSVLQARGIEPSPISNLITGNGYCIECGDPSGGYVVYAKM
jgi:FkbM family methyltransferase